MTAESPPPACILEPSIHSEHCSVIAADHPCLAGHFPGNPVVPGVVILETVVHAFAEWQPDHPVIGMPMVKFLAPLRPDHAFTIGFRGASKRGIPFECIGADGQPLVRGYLTVAGAESQAAAGTTLSVHQPPNADTRDHEHR